MEETTTTQSIGNFVPAPFALTRIMKRLKKINPDIHKIDLKKLLKRDDIMDKATASQKYLLDEIDTGTYIDMIEQLSLSTLQTISDGIVRMLDPFDVTVEDETVDELGIEIIGESRRDGAVEVSVLLDEGMAFIDLTIGSKHVKEKVNQSDAEILESVDSLLSKIF